MNPLDENFKPLTPVSHPIMFAGALRLRGFHNEEEMKRRAPLPACCWVFLHDGRVVTFNGWMERAAFKRAVKRVEGSVIDRVRITFNGATHDTSPSRIDLDINDDGDAFRLWFTLHGPAPITTTWEC